MDVRSAAANVVGRLRTRLNSPEHKPATTEGDPRRLLLLARSRDHETRIAQLEGRLVAPKPANEKERLTRRYGPVRKDKIRFIAFAFNRFRARSFADLGEPDKGAN